MTIKEQLQQKANADGKAYGYVTISSGKNDTLMCSKYKDGTFHEFDVTWAEYFRDEYGDNWKSETIFGELVTGDFFDTDNAPYGNMPFIAVRMDNGGYYYYCYSETLGDLDVNIVYPQQNNTPSKPEITPKPNADNEEKITEKPNIIPSHNNGSSNNGSSVVKEKMPFLLIAAVLYFILKK